MKKAHRDKIVADLHRMLTDEPRQLTRLRRVMRLIKVTGWFVLLVCFSLAFMESEAVSPWIYTAAAAIGGALIGIGVWLENTLLTWPVLKEFIDRDRLAQAMPPTTGE
ncbi:MAG: hypothetical protein PVI37_12190 [Gammaproteobacteria bacterium]|jgi:hypothetical protein